MLKLGCRRVRETGGADAFSLLSRGASRGCNSRAGAWGQPGTRNQEQAGACAVRQAARPLQARHLHALPGGPLVWLRKLAAFPVPVASLVFPVVHLDALSLAGIAHQAEPDSDAPRSSRRSRLPSIPSMPSRCCRRRTASCSPQISPTAFSSSGQLCRSSRWQSLPWCYSC